MNLNDTIVAQSSANGSGARGIVRLSGPMTPAILRRLGLDFDARAILAGSLRLNAFHTPIPAEIVFFQAPHSYTGGDLAEIHTVSSPPIVDGLIEQSLSLGARAAGPGEFTQRAFLAGKIDLTKAEAIQAVIESRRDDDLKTALGQLAGNLARPLDTLRDDLLNLLADLEAALDFADESIEFVSNDDALSRLSAALAHLQNLKNQLDSRSLSGSKYRVVLAGPPNAGKSSLFNALAGRDAAMVSPAPGTTRDYLIATLALAETEIEIVDTAGSRLTADSIESKAQMLGEAESARADLVIWCSEQGDSPALACDHLVLGTKADLHGPRRGMNISTATRQGIEELKALLNARALAWARSPLAPSRSRCSHHVESAAAALRRAHNHVLEADPPELAALELRIALAEIGAMVGAVYTNDLLDRIFSRFCIGK